MNIAVFARSTVDHFSSGGMETQLQNLVEGLAEQGHAITVITTAYPDRKFPGFLLTDHELVRKKVRYVFAGDTTPGLRPLSAWEKLVSWMPFFHRGVQKEGSKNYYAESGRIFDDLHVQKPFDLILSQSTIAYGILKSRSISDKKAKTVPMISIIHGTIRSELMNRFHANKSFFNWGRFLGVDIPNWIIELFTINKTFFFKTHKIVAVSSALKDSFIREHPECADKTVVIYNGVDARKFFPAFSKRKNFRALYVGRLDREKGVDVIIACAKKLKDMDTPLDIDVIGGGSPAYVSELKLLAEKYEVSDTVHFLGSVSNEKLSEYYQRSSAFVFPTRRQEGHPMTISEAYLCGLPVIATAMGGLRELIIPDKTGYFIETNDAEQLAERLQFLSKNPKVLKTLSTGAAEYGSQNFSQHAMIEKYERLFQKKRI